MILLKITSWDELLMGSAIGISVVFIALATLVILFELLQTIMLSRNKKKQVKAGKKEEEIKDIPANEIAAISMALHLFANDIHDNESNIITIKRIERRYSPWNSKIYGLNNTINR